MMENDQTKQPCEHPILIRFGLEPSICGAPLVRRKPGAPYVLKHNLTKRMYPFMVGIIFLLSFIYPGFDCGSLYIGPILEPIQPTRKIRKGVAVASESNESTALVG